MVRYPGFKSETRLYAHQNQHAAMTFTSEDEEYKTRYLDCNAPLLPQDDTRVYRVTLHKVYVIQIDAKGERWLFTRLYFVHSMNLW